MCHIQSITTKILITKTTMYVFRSPFTVHIKFKQCGDGGEVSTGFWWGNLREGDHWGDPGVDGGRRLG
jgi:hypothetical protein